jgi:hypothetical protein
MFSYYYFIYIFYPVFISCVIAAWWAIFVVESRFMGWPTTMWAYLSQKLIKKISNIREKKQPADGATRAVTIAYPFGSK